MEKISFNSQWILSHNPQGIMANLMGGAARQETANLPHDALISQPRSAGAPSGANMGYFIGEDVSYTKSFFVPEEERDKVHYLNFDGIYMDAIIYVNGRFAHRQPYGYTPCTVRLDEFLNFGAENSVNVLIRGSNLPNSRWYSGQGIYRDVWYMTAEPLHIPCDGVHVTTLDCEPELAVVEIETQVENAGTLSEDAHVEVEVFGPDGGTVAKRRARFYVKAGGQVLVRQRVDLDAPALWDVDSPSLYTCRCRIVKGGADVDAAGAVFGIRKLQLDSRHGLRINGRSVKLKGGCVHHDNGVIGAVSLPDAEERRIRLLKEGGYNAVRTSHNPPSAAFLDACDKLGMLVMHEFTDMWVQGKSAFDYSANFPTSWEKDVEDVVRRDYNHPSIIMWSIGNEIPETGDPISTQWGRRLVEKFKALDHTRYVTNGLNVMVSCSSHIAEMMANQPKPEEPGGVNDVIGGGDFMDQFATNPFTDQFVEESCDMLDLIGYNYTNARYEREHPLHPEWVFFGSETFPADLDVNWATVTSHPYVIGDFSWTAWDYLGETGCGRIENVEDGGRGFCGDYPWIAASDGDFDLTGYRRPMSYWRSIIWGGEGHKPYIAVHRMPNYGKEQYVSRWAFTDAVRSWTWPGYEGKPTAIEVYSDADEVELLVNGQSLGRKPVDDGSRKFYCKWEAEYQPGEVVAIAYAGGQEVGRDVLQTAGESAVCLTADKTALRAGSGDLCHVEIELRDGNAVLDMAAQTEATVCVSGPVQLLGCGSGNPVTEEKYQDVTHALYEGRLLAVLKAGSETGKATVTVTVPGKEDAVIEIQVV